MGIREILTVLFVSLGLFFATVSVIGTIRQKDVFVLPADRRGRQWRGHFAVLQRIVDL